MRTMGSVAESPRARGAGGAGGGAVGGWAEPRGAPVAAEELVLGQLFGPPPFYWLLFIKTIVKTFSEKENRHMMLN